MFGCESLAVAAQAFLRETARDAVENSDLSILSYARYRADDFGPHIGRMFRRGTRGAAENGRSIL
jgi:hypothetical protein